MKTIEEPEFIKSYDDPSETYKVGLTEFRRWFRKEVWPVNKLLEEAVELNGINHGCWFEYGSRAYENTHKAYLIGIETIKKETAEDVLRDLVEKWAFHEHSDTPFGKLYKRSKRVLEDK